MKILVTGASGLLGRSLMRLLEGRSDLEAKGVAFSRAKPPLERLDLTDEAAVARFFDREAPEVVAHLAAERRPNVVDLNVGKAQAINVDATRTIARECAARGAFLLLISTDYVFDGSSPPYYPDSATNPLNAYGRMKLESELVAEKELGGGALLGIGGGMADDSAAGSLLGAMNDTPARRPVGTANNIPERCPRGAVLRIPMLYGPVESLAESSVTEVALALKSMDPRKVEHWASRYPAHVDDVSEAILAVIDACRGDMGGRFGAFPRFLLSGRPAYTKYEMALIMAASLGLDVSHIQADPSPPSGAPRPRDCRMDTALLESIGWSQKKQFEAEIGGILKPFFE